MSNLHYQKNKNFFLILKIAYQKKQKFFTYFSTSTNLIIILKKLQEKSLIQGFFQKNFSEIQVFLRYDMQSLPAISNILLFPKARYLSIKTLKSMKNDYFLSLSLLNTRFGILDINDCHKKNCGGELFVTIL